MQLIVSNTVDSDVILYIDKSGYLIKAGAENLAFNLSDGRHLLKVKREKSIPPPAFKKAFWTEFLGIFSLLFFKPWFYIFDVSSTYVLDASDECVHIDIVREEKAAAEGYYDVVKAEAAFSSLQIVKYTAENETEVVAAYKKVQKAVCTWGGIIAEIVCTLLSMAMTYPILLAIYAATKSPIIIFLLIAEPICMFGVVALIVLLSTHLFNEYQYNKFCRNMKSEEIYSCLEKKAESAKWKIF